MKKQNTLRIATLLIAIALLQTACGKGSETEPEELALTQPMVASYQAAPTSAPDLITHPVQVIELEPAEEITEIRNATVLIRMQSPQMEKVNGLGVFLGSGIGSLIRINEEILLVTHNHWGEMLQDLTIVEFRTADSQMIVPLFGKDFKKLILSQDAGTLVLQPPQELIDRLVPVAMDDLPQVAVGEIVTLVYRENPAREKATLQQAVVEELITYKDLPAYKLRSLEGQPIQPGDSGGGIWFQGALVGNSWVSVGETVDEVAETSSNSVEDKITYTDVSYAAILRLDIP